MSQDKTLSSKTNTLSEGGRRGAKYTVMHVREVLAVLDRTFDTRLFQRIEGDPRSRSEKRDLTSSFHLLSNPPESSTSKVEY